MLSLWRAEWLKVRKRPANWGILIVTLAILLLGIMGMIGVALYEGSESETFSSIQTALAYPQSLELPILIVSQLAVFLAVIFVANSIGSEYSRDTWKMILVRHKNRIPFILIKLLSGFVFMVLLIVIAVILALLLSAIGSLILGGDVVANTSIDLITPYFKSIVAILMNVAFYSAVTLIAAILTRSSIGGIVIGIVSSIAFGIMGLFSNILARISPDVHLQNIQAQWVLKQEQINASIAAMMGYSEPVSAWTSLMVVIGYTLVFLSIGLYMFRRRDIAGS